MRHAQKLRMGAIILLTGWAGSTGCIHNHYYGTVPVCEVPAGATSAPYGAVCDVPPQVDGAAVVVQTPGRTTVVGGSPGPSRVLISEPQGGGMLVRGGPRRTWRSSDPEGLATTRVEGALDDDSTIK